jgi:hypothetical protein
MNEEKRSIQVLGKNSAKRDFGKKKTTENLGMKSSMN